MADIKSYQPKSKSLSSGQILLRNYSFEEGKLLLKEMADSLCLDLAQQGLTAGSVSIVVGYSYETGLKHSAGSVSLPDPSNSYQAVMSCALRLYERIVQRGKPIRRINVTCSGIGKEEYQQYHLFTDAAAMEREKKLQQAVLEIKRRFGKNALVRGMDLLEAGTARKRNRQIGGHKSGE